MIPHERSLVKKLEGKPFALIGVNSDQDEKELAEQLKEHQVTWRSFKNGNGGKTISNDFKVSGWPTLFLIDHKGVVRKKWVGSPANEVLDKEIDKLVAEAEKGS